MLVRVAVGDERALSNSKTAVNMHMTELEFGVLKSVQKRIHDATSQNCDGYCPNLQLLVLP